MIILAMKDAEISGKEKLKRNISYNVARNKSTQIFEDGVDCEKFIQVIVDYKAISGYKIFAYCLLYLFLTTMV